MNDVSLRVKAAYDELAWRYDQDRYRKKSMRRRGIHERSFVMDRLLPGGRVLEIGCGTGRITQVLLEKSTSVTAVDISEAMLDVLREKLDPPDSLTLIRSDIHDLSRRIEPGSFDTVVCLRALPHMEHITEALATIGKTVRPGGQVICDLWNDHSLIGVARKLLGRTHRIPTFHHTYAEMRQLLEAARLDVLNELPLWIRPRLVNGINSPLTTRFAYSVLFDTRKRGSSQLDSTPVPGPGPDRSG